MYGVTVVREVCGIEDVIVLSAVVVAGEAGVVVRVVLVVTVVLVRVVVVVVTKVVGSGCQKHSSISVALATTHAVLPTLDLKSSAAVGSDDNHE